MKHRCAICGRPTVPFAYIGTEAIGPKCAQRAGLMPSKVAKAGRVRFVRAAPAKREPIPQTIDMFDGV